MEDDIVDEQKMKTFVRDMELDTGICLSVHQQCVGDVGAVVWDSALATCKLFEQRHARQPDCFVGKRVLELGAGTGVCSLVLATLGAHVVATDLPEQLALLRLNISVNQRHFTKGSMRVEALDWTCQEARNRFHDVPFDMILMVDCIYYESSIQPLIDTVDALATPNTELLCMYEQRCIGQPQVAQRLFFDLIQSCFTVERVPVDQQHPDYVCDDIHLLKLIRKNKCS